MERYFSQPHEVKMLDARPEVSYQARLPPLSARGTGSIPLSAVNARGAVQEQARSA